ncbi:MAG TPA: hypothetical protein VIS74_04385 [Chthoniobacterales bacterium]
MQSGAVASELLFDRPEFKYFPPEDFARLDYGRLLWKAPAGRARLLAHWNDPRHPYRERFLRHRPLLESLLSCALDRLDDAAVEHGQSLRAAIREIPPVFGHFWADSLRENRPVA